MLVLISHRRAAKAKARLRICAVSPESLLLAYTKYESYVFYNVGDDAWISEGSFMQTIHLCVLIHI